MRKLRLFSCLILGTNLAAYGEIGIKESSHGAGFDVAFRIIDRNIILVFDYIIIEKIICFCYNLCHEYDMVETDTRRTNSLFQSEIAV